ncbi:beta-ketoacyl reductase [Streptomyces indonesiensis]
MARWLAANGADHVVLLSRQGGDAPGAAELVADLTDVRVTVAACDVTDRDAVAAVLAEAERTHPLTAVVHTAGAGLPPAPVTEVTAEEFAAVTGAKVRGALVLDGLVGDRELDAFVLFSSGAGVWGSGGQAPYGAGNAFLDGLAQRRRARGLAATSVAWGGWGGGVGMIDADGGDQWRRIGILPMDPAPALRAMARAVGGGPPNVIVADIDWARFVPGYTMARERPLLRQLPEVAEILAADAPGGGASRREVLLDSLAELTGPEREAFLTDLVRREAAAVLGHADGDAVEPERAFKDTGFDSLTAVELRNRINAATGLQPRPRWCSTIRNPPRWRGSSVRSCCPPRTRPPTGPWTASRTARPPTPTAVSGRSVGCLPRCRCAASTSSGCWTRWCASRTPRPVSRAG